jgi:hypothetical protein
MLWENLSYSVVKDKKIDAKLASDGFVVAGNVGPQALQELRNVHQSNHDFEVNQGGMFYSVYSLDIPYRKRIFKEIDAILSPLYTTLFQNFKPVLHSFIVKVNGDNSEFTLHQDSTGLDEFQFSPLSVWIPLQDTQLENGCLCVVPHSHRIKVPYRGISFEGPFQNITETVRQYLQPIPMKAGDILLFDNRILHYSPANESTEHRVVVMSGIFPKNATILSCYQDTTIENAPIEIYEQESDFLLTGENFYHDCTIRPTTGSIIKKVESFNTPFSDNDFIEFTNKVGLKPLSIDLLQNNNLKMHIISEPKEKTTKSLLNKFVALFK